MRCFAVALPAKFPLAMFDVFRRHRLERDAADQRPVTAFAVFFNDSNASLFGSDNLRLHVKSKHGRMPKPVHRFEGILVKHVIVRDMAVIADRNPPVTAVLPGHVFRPHDMAVDTGFRIVGKVRDGI